MSMPLTERYFSRVAPLQNFNNILYLAQPAYNPLWRHDDHAAIQNQLQKTKEIPA
jgi:hypothetical protein